MGNIRTAIVNYGMGNVDSIRRAALHVGTEVVVTDNPATILTSDRIILPGVGSFPEAMRGLRERALFDVLRTAHERVPILGVCLGMQLLGDSSEEDGGAEGLGIIPGKTVKIVGGIVPHMGWNGVYQALAGDDVFDGIPDAADFYFCHSYRFEADRARSVIGLTPYADSTVSAIRRGLTVGVQFHPEKSQKNGLKLLHNFIHGSAA